MLLVLHCHRANILLQLKSEAAINTVNSDIWGVKIPSLINTFCLMEHFIFRIPVCVSYCQRICRLSLFREEMASKTTRSKCQSELSAFWLTLPESIFRDQICSCRLQCSVTRAAGFQATKKLFFSLGNKRNEESQKIKLGGKNSYYILWLEVSLFFPVKAV